MSDKVGNVLLFYSVRKGGANKVRGKEDEIMSCEDKVDYDDILNEICGCLRGLPTEIGKLHTQFPKMRIGDRVWTEVELARLYNLAKDNKCRACPTFGEKWRDGEWLYDMVWYRDAEKTKDLVPGIYRALENTVLVLESEWCKSAWEVQYDFEKLLIAKAFIKVLVVNDIGESLAKKIVEDGLKYYNGNISGERYLLAMYSEKTDGFVFWRTSLGQKELKKCPIVA